jgi:hypothetical protein
MATLVEYSHGYLDMICIEEMFGGSSYVLFLCLIEFSKYGYDFRRLCCLY